jgi:hypothetical protein
MKARCHSPNATGYHNYGGRGISVFPEWIKSFEAFARDVGPPPSKAHSLDRFPDTNGNYQPGNVRWATKKEQLRNQRKNISVTVDGRKMSLAEAVELKGLKYNTVLYRIRRGKTPAEALA